MSPAKQQRYDLIIVGAGMIGSALAIGLRNSGLKLALIEARPFNSNRSDDFDQRNLVLSLASQRILQPLGLWHALAKHVTPITSIHISEQQRFGSVLLQARQLGVDALAYSLKARELGQALHAGLASMDDLDLLCPASAVAIEQDADSASVVLQQGDETSRLQARLLVIADGSDSHGRELLGIKSQQKDYQQQAIVCNVASELGHRHTAFERFSETGPMALLPTNSDRQSGMVFVVPNERLQHYMDMDETAFLQAASQRFGRRLGRFVRLGTRQHYPLRLINARQHIKQRALLLGNSAHTLHPNAAQGFNLGLRDVACLAELLIAASRSQQDIGAESVLNNYINGRRADQQRVIRFTDGLARLFYNRDRLKSGLRSLLMAATEHSPLLKSSLMVRAMGLYGLPATRTGE